MNNHLAISLQPYGGHCGFIDFFPFSCWYEGEIEQILDAVGRNVMNTASIESLSNREQFLSLVIERLGRSPIDFKEKLDFIKRSKNRPEPHSAAGVLLILHHTGSHIQPGEQGEFIFQLIKRSARVSQPGNLTVQAACCTASWTQFSRP